VVLHKWDVQAEVNLKRGQHITAHPACGVLLENIFGWLGLSGLLTARTNARLKLQWLGDVLAERTSQRVDPDKAKRFVQLIIVDVSESITAENDPFGEVLAYSFTFDLLSNYIQDSISDVCRAYVARITRRRPGGGEYFSPLDCRDN